MVVGLARESHGVGYDDVTDRWIKEKHIKFNSSSQKPTLPTPKRLLQLPLLARLVNAVLTGLKPLCRCLLPGLFRTLRQCLETHELLAVEKEMQSAALRASAPRLSTTFCDLLGPGYSSDARNHQVQLLPGGAATDAAKEATMDGAEQEVEDDDTLVEVTNKNVDHFMETTADVESSLNHKPGAEPYEISRKILL
jgi:hypothetical protein